MVLNMKIFKVEKDFVPISRPEIVINKGEYPIVDWRINSFSIKINNIDVYLKQKETIPNGKVKVIIEDKNV